MYEIYNRVSQRVPVLKRPAIRQFIKFSIVGVSNTVIDFSLYFLLTRYAQLHFLLANALAFAVAVSWSYFINKRWTFRDASRSNVIQYGKFIAISAIGLGINEGVLSFFVLALGFPDLIAKLGAVVVVMFWNFLANRAWTFSPSSGEVARNG